VTPPRCPAHPGQPTGPLIQCRSCRSWTRWLGTSGWCRNCTHGWVFCLEHARLEHTGTVHRRVSVRDVLDTTESAPPVEPRSRSLRRRR
jgi:hypothetical protein